MISVDEAFRKFRSKLELNQREQDNASTRQNEVRDFLATRFARADDFLTGSYARHTKTKPLKDIDIFFVLRDSERKKYRDQLPSVVLTDFHAALADKYGAKAVCKQARSIKIDFAIVYGIAVDENDNTDYRVLSIDVVPAFASGSDFEIPDDELRKWIKTNPKIHAEKAIAAQQAYSSEWKGIVRMVKYWNNNPRHIEKPVKPSFLLEVMALQCLYGGWGGSFEREFQSLFPTLADRIFEDWPDPAGLGPPISNGMTRERKERAQKLLREAGRDADAAIHLAGQGRNGDALKAWRRLFGPKFPQS